MLKPLARIALALALLAPPALAQTADDLYRLGRREPAAGARMAALGGAAVAGLGDWTAAGANPAGLGYLTSRQVAAATHAFSAEADGFRGGDVQGVTLGALGAAAALPVARGALAFGAGYRETAVYAYRPRLETGWQGEITVAGAAALTPRLLGGLAVNAPVGRYRTGAYEVATGDGYDVVGTNANLYGVSARGGLSLALDYGVRLGLAVETPTYLRVEHEGMTRETEVVPPYDVAMTTPWRFAVGFLAGSEAVLVTADVEVVDWGQARFDTDGHPDFRREALARENAFADARFRAVIHSRVGAEARLGAVALRVGAAFQPDPRFDGPVPEAVWQQYGFGVGVTVHPQARLDLAYVHTRDEGASGPFLGERALRNALQAGVDVRF